MSGQALSRSAGTSTWGERPARAPRGTAATRGRARVTTAMAAGDPHPSGWRGRARPRSGRCPSEQNSARAVRLAGNSVTHIKEDPVGHQISRRTLFRTASGLAVAEGARQLAQRLLRRYRGRLHEQQADHDLVGQRRPAQRLQEGARHVPEVEPEDQDPGDLLRIRRVLRQVQHQHRRWQRPRPAPDGHRAGRPVRPQGCPRPDRRVRRQDPGPDGLRQDASRGGHRRRQAVRRPVRHRRQPAHRQPQRPGGPRPEAAGPRVDLGRPEEDLPGRLQEEQRQDLRRRRRWRRRPPVLRDLRP